jgi:lipopolysaccharide transport system permease protein
MHQKITIITSKSKTGLNFDTLWNYRELFIFFCLRDIKLRYRRLPIAVFWTIVPPLLMSSVFELSLGKVMPISPAHLPYLLFAYLGLIFWNFFSGILFRSSSSLLNNQSLITKTFFPRILLPLSAASIVFVDFVFAFLLFTCLMYFYRIDINFLYLLIFIPALVISFLFASGIGIAFSALNIKYKDIRDLLPMLTSLLFFLTPVIYPVKLVSHYYYPLLYLNPLMGVIDTVRTTIFGQSTISWFGLGVSTISSLIIFVIGISYFQKVESELVDII